VWHRACGDFFICTGEHKLSICACVGVVVTSCIYRFVYVYVLLLRGGGDVQVGGACVWMVISRARLCGGLRVFYTKHLHIPTMYVYIPVLCATLH